MRKETLEYYLEQGLSVERIARRFGKHPSTVSYWLEKFGLESQFGEKHPARGGIDGAQLETLVAAGMSITQLAAELGMSKGTVRHWLRRYGMRTERTVRIERQRAAKAAGEVWRC